MLIDIFMLKNPKLIGELLRSIVFLSDKDKLGCYQTFEIQNTFQEISHPLQLKEIANRMKNSSWNDELLDFNSISAYEQYCDDCLLTVAWKWEGDGILYFKVKNKDDVIEVINDDCKKENNWSFIK